MGAAWALRSDYTSLLIPGFSFGQMVGVVNNNVIAIKLDNDRVEVKDKLNQLYARIAKEFGLRRKPDVVWEQKRDRFIDDVLSIVLPPRHPMMTLKCWRADFSFGNQRLPRERTSTIVQPVIQIIKSCIQLSTAAWREIAFARIAK